MKAVVYTKYGPPEVLQLKEVDKPVPKDKEILVKIVATAVNAADWRLRKADPVAVKLFFGLTRPKKSILGGVLSGIVESVGSKVTRFKAGDQVFGSTGMSLGAYAEYICLPENGIVAMKPYNLSYVEAATVPFGGHTAIHFLRKANIKPGQKILIYGASGAVGTAAIQLAKLYGAEVTGVCSTANVDLVKSLGADRVMDYTKDEIDGEHYDVIFDTVGKIPYEAVKKTLKKKGTWILGASGFSQMFQGYWSGMTNGYKIISGLALEKEEDIRFLKELIEKGKYRAVIDKSYPMEQLSVAHSYVEKGHKKGNVGVIIDETYNQ
ncbi:NAD(P)-dependent alcohol dehydrogenase [Sutcliffiella horikoshii]|uniref:NAD(P)-dependent alcohol dehydrogenase n=1 Tax=Sutcliffiella horikoshii TaxID=79883 RepID=A0A5D4T223_9BACI|nr:NAD(P)-dependent alcohol dehydrogenase [Sutcliffiella horikoshii]TYS68176.1 NAD(P)-dependent alcohol dehydrogenase [Sutcliffiella horikoshii]